MTNGVLLDCQRHRENLLTAARDSRSMLLLERGQKLSRGITTNQIDPTNYSFSRRLMFLFFLFFLSFLFAFYDDSLVSIQWQYNNVRETDARRVPCRVKITVERRWICIEKKFPTVCLVPWTNKIYSFFLSRGDAAVETRPLSTASKGEAERSTRTRGKVSFTF